MWSGKQVWLAEGDSRPKGIKGETRPLKIWEISCFLVHLSAIMSQETIYILGDLEFHYALLIFWNNMGVVFVQATQQTHVRINLQNSFLKDLGYLACSPGHVCCSPKRDTSWQVLSMLLKHLIKICSQGKAGLGSPMWPTVKLWAMPIMW